MRPERTVCVCSGILLVLLVLLVLSTPAAGAAGSGGGDELSLSLDTRAPIRFDAGLEATGGTGLLATWERPADVQLSAERVTVWMETSEGERIAIPTGGQSWHQTSHTETNTTFHDAVVTAWAWKAPGQLLLEPTPEAEATADATARGRTSLHTIQDQTLAWAGIGGSRAFARDAGAPTYDHRVEDPLARLDQADSAQATGDFTLFVNNVTVSIQTHEDEGAVWSNWTGLRTSPVAEPVGGGESVQEYELRITRLVVENGTLEVAAPDAVSLVGPSLAIESDGLVRAARAEGRVVAPDETLRLADDEVVLAGQARTTARPSPTEAATGAGLSEEAPLNVTSLGDLELVYTTGQREQPAEPAKGGLPFGWLLPLGALVAAVGTGSVAVHRPEVLRPLPTRWTDTLYGRWEEAGLTHEQQGHFSQAASYYQRLVRLEPGRPMGWFLLARARLDGGDPQAAIQAVEAAGEQADAFPLDLLEIKVNALVHREAWGEVGTLLDEIAARGPEVARGLVVDLGLDHVVEQRGADWWGKRPSRGQGIDGYA